MSRSLAAERDRIQREVEELEQSLSVSQAELELLSSETGACLLTVSLPVYQTLCLFLTVLSPHWSGEESDDDVTDEEAEQVMYLLTIYCVYRKERF